MVALWAAAAFWGSIFIVRGLSEINSLFFIDKIYGFVFAFIGFLLLFMDLHYVYKVRKVGFTEIVLNFLNKRFLEIMTTTIFMLGIAVIVSQDISFILIDFLLFPLFAGTSFGYGFGTFMRNVLHLGGAHFIVLASAWLLELFWMYIWARMVVKIILRFRLKSKID